MNSFFFNNCKPGCISIPSFDSLGRLRLSLTIQRCLSSIQYVLINWSRGRSHTNSDVLSVPLPAPESNQCWSARRTRFDALSRGQFRFLRRQAPGLATFFCVATEEALVLHLTALATVSTQCFANAWLSVGRDIWQSAEAWAMNEFLRVAGTGNRRLCR